MADTTPPHGARARTQLTAAVTSPESFPRPPPPTPGVTPTAADTPEFFPAIDSFALELRAESIEQLSGGDALRRGESERIEAGRSETNADLVTGRDRVQVQGPLSEHTGHGIVVQATHIETTVGGSFDTRAGKEDTMLLAGHMRDTWNGGTAVVAAMSDDTAAGGGVRLTGPLDLWVHGLMGLEERAGTCTADAVLAEVCGTLYEREYRSAVHGAGLAVFNGTLYQSVRASFRPLVRVSMGVRNLIAAGGGDVPSDAPPPAPGGGGEQGADAAAATLAAGSGAAETSQTGQEVARLDIPAVLTQGSDVAAVTSDLSEINRSTGTAEQIGGLQDALRVVEAESGGEVASGARVSGAGANASGPPAGGAEGLHDGQPTAVALDANVPAPQAGGPRGRGTAMKLGLLGGADDPTRRASDGLDWRTAYRELNSQYGRFREIRTPHAIFAYNRAIDSVDARVMETFRHFGGHITRLRQRTGGLDLSVAAYDSIERMARRADRTGNMDRADAIRQALQSIDQFTRKIADNLSARAAEFAVSHPVEIQPVGPGPGIAGAPVPGLPLSPVGPSPGIAGAPALGLAISPVGPSPGIAGAPVPGLAISPVGPSPGIAGAPVPGLLISPVGPGPGIAGDPVLAVPLPPGGLGQTPDVSGPDPVSSLSYSLLTVPAGAHAGGAAPRPVHAEAMVTPQIGTESTFWLQPFEPALPTSTVRFETGLQRVGEPPAGVASGPGEAATGAGQVDDTQRLLEFAAGVRALEEFDTPPPGATGDTAPALHAGASTVDPDSGLLFGPAPWAEDDFAVERALIAGRLPPNFDPSELVTQWGWVGRVTELTSEIESGRLPFGAIDSMIERSRSVERETTLAMLVPHLQDMKAGIAGALATAYGRRAAPDWLAIVDEFLQAGPTTRAADEGSAPGSRVLDDLIEAGQASPQPSPLEFPGDVRRADVLWHTGEPEAVRALGTDQGAERVSVPVARPPGQRIEPPGSVAPTSSPPVPREISSDVARAFPDTSADLGNIEWNALETLLELLDDPITIS